MLKNVMFITISQGRNVTESKLCQTHFITLHICITMQLQARAPIPSHIIQGRKKFESIQIHNQVGYFSMLLLNNGVHSSTPHF